MPISINQKGYPGFNEPQLEALEQILNDTADQASVSGGVQLTTAAAIADTGPRTHLTPGRITDGDEAGTPVVWWSPSGAGGFWGYDISPSDKFGV